MSPPPIIGVDFWPLFVISRKTSSVTVSPDARSMNATRSGLPALIFARGSVEAFRVITRVVEETRRVEVWAIYAKPEREDMRPEEIIRLITEYAEPRLEDSDSPS